MGFKSRARLRAALRERSFLEVNERHAGEPRKARRRIARAWATRDYRLILSDKEPRWS